MRMNPGDPISAQCLYRESTDETLGPWIDVRGCAFVSFYCTSHGTTSGGVITIEEAAPESFTNTSGINPPPVFGGATDAYSVITTVNASSFSATKQVAVHITNASFCFVRARISTAISGGGTVSVGCVAY